MTTESTAHVQSALVGRIGAGIAGGLVGGLVFGIMMAIDGMLPMIAQLVGAESVAVGWVVHLGIAVFIGATFALIFSRLAGSVLAATGLGLLYGAVWWVLGALLLMPAWLGMTEMIFAWNETTRNSLLGHLVFGVLLGLVYGLLRPRLTNRG
jgi:uncharacterized membrane protein YagU involved in acid resistance